MAGTIEALGPETSDWSVGDRVMTLVGGGGYAEYAVAHAGHLIPVPEKAAIVSEFKAQVLPSLVDRKIVPLVHKVYGLEEAAQAHRDREASVHFGKIVLAIQATNPRSRSSPLLRVIRRWRLAYRLFYESTYRPRR